MLGEDPRFPPCDQVDDRSFAQYDPPISNQGGSRVTEDHPGLQIHDQHEGDPAYRARFTALYPFSMVDFNDSATHDGHFTKTGPAEENLYAKPEECDPCEELRREL